MTEPAMLDGGARPRVRFRYAAPWHADEARRGPLDIDLAVVHAEDIVARDIREASAGSWPITSSRSSPTPPWSGSWSATSRPTGSGSTRSWPARWARSPGWLVFELVPSPAPAGP
jgi:hypothetical protein